jgi:hypothetical protein
MYIFDMLDLITLLGICNKDRFMRQLSIILMAETGKLKRLLVHQTKYRNGLYDILYYEK